MTKRGRRRAIRRNVEENVDEIVVISTVHNSSVKLTNVDERVETLHLIQQAKQSGNRRGRKPARRWRISRQEKQ